MPVLSYAVLSLLACLCGNVSVIRKFLHKCCVCETRNFQIQVMIEDTKEIRDQRRARSADCQGDNRGPMDGERDACKRSGNTRCPESLDLG